MLTVSSRLRGLEAVATPAHCKFLCFKLFKAEGASF